jgi:hypothetical protein
MAASGPQRNKNVNKRTHCIALWLTWTLFYNSREGLVDVVVTVKD